MKPPALPLLPSTSAPAWSAPPAPDQLRTGAILAGHPLPPRDVLVGTASAAGIEAPRP